MADYRQECRTPGCAYTGFSGHSPFCPVPEESFRREQERRQAEKDRKRAYFEILDGMDEYELFSYMDELDYQIKAASEAQRRFSEGMDYLRANSKALAYLDHRSDRRRNERAGL